VRLEADISSITTIRDGLAGELERSISAQGAGTDNLNDLQAQMQCITADRTDLQGQLDKAQTARKAAVLSAVDRMLRQSQRVRSNRSLEASFAAWKLASATSAAEQRTQHERQRSAHLEEAHAASVQDMAAQIEAAEAHAQGKQAMLRAAGAQTRATAMKAVVRMLRNRTQGADWGVTATRFAFQQWRVRASLQACAEEDAHTIASLQQDVKSAVALVPVPAGTPWPLVLYSMATTLTVLAGVVLLAGFTGHLDMWLAAAPQWLAGLLTALVTFLGGLLRPAGGTPAVDAASCPYGYMPQWQGLQSAGVALLECTKL
jgi:hypothetical protein